VAQERGKQPRGDLKTARKLFGNVFLGPGACKNGKAEKRRGHVGKEERRQNHTEIVIQDYGLEDLLVKGGAPL